MDNQKHDSLVRKSFANSWNIKKSKYEDEDLQVYFSPPDESSFVHLPFGAHHSGPNQSLFDRINKELGCTLEKSNENVTSAVNVGPALKPACTQGLPAQLSLGPRGVILANCRQQRWPTANLGGAAINGNDSPPIIPATILEKREEELAATIATTIATTITTESIAELKESAETAHVAQQDLDSLVRKARGGRPTKKISMNLAGTLDPTFLESIQDLRLRRFESELEAAKVAEQQQIATAPAQGTASDARDRRRKTSAPPSLNPMLPENQKAANCFFTGSLFAPLASSTPSLFMRTPLTARDEESPLAVRTPATTVSEPPSPMRHEDSGSGSDGGGGGGVSLERSTMLMEEKTKEAAAMEAKPRAGRRRPRASALREMNFWAPQSM